MKLLLTQLIICCLFLNFANAEPTEKREWKSNSGSKIEAIALRVSSGQVHLKKSNGKVIRVKMYLLSDEDQKFLKEHFKLGSPAGGGKKNPDVAENGKIAGSGEAPAEDLALPAGKISGPIKANGSTYFVYVPKTLKKGRKASLLFYTNAGGGNRNILNKFKDTAETLGWITAVSVESKNSGSNNSMHVANCLKHILDTLPVDDKRIHYAGYSGGAALAFKNSTKKKAFGIMPCAGYIPAGVKISTKVIYGTGGGSDFNRYATAYAAKSFKKNGFHRISSHGHGVSPGDHFEDGMIWMHCKYLKMGRPSSDEKKDFEASIINWMNDLKKTNPKRAYSTACILRDVYKISGQNASQNNLIIRELSADKTNVLYHEGLLDVNKLSVKHLSKVGETRLSVMNHLCKSSAGAAKRLKKKYESVPEITAVLNAIMRKTSK